MTEAAFIILKEHGKPLHVKEIIRIALANKMFETKGKTPTDTLRVQLTNENIRKVNRGNALRFCYLGKSMWGLTEWGFAPYERPKRRER
jgi:hypothetical protein